MREANTGIKRKKKQTFSGADAVEWLVQKTSSSQPVRSKHHQININLAQDAINLCQKLLSAGYIRPVVIVEVAKQTVAGDITMILNTQNTFFVGGEELYQFEVQ